MNRCFQRLPMISMAIAMSSIFDQARAVETVFTDNVRIQTATDQTLFFEKTGASPQIWKMTGSGGGFSLIDDTTTVPFWKQKFFVAANSDITAQLFDQTFQISSLGGCKLVFGDLSDTNTVEWSFGTSGSGLSVTNMNGGGIFPANSVPFSIEQGTPTDTLVVASVGFGSTVRGHVGIGTASPENIGGNATGGNTRHLNVDAGTGQARLIAQGQTGAEFFLVHKGGLSNRKIVKYGVSGGKFNISSVLDNLSGNVEPSAFCLDLATSNVGIKTGSPTKPLQVGDSGQSDGNGAHCTPGGVWQQGSSRTVKDDIEPVSLDLARETIRALQPVTYRYKNERDEQYVGFISEDVPELVATKGRKHLAPMDVTAVLTRVVQEQDRKLEEQQQLNKRSEEVITGQQAQLAKLTTRLEQLERKLANQ